MIPQGILIKAWASMKSFKPRDGGGDAPPAGGGRSLLGCKPNCFASNLIQKAPISPCLAAISYHPCHFFATLIAATLR
jgi:hypothetical protein